VVLGLEFSHLLTYF